MTAIFPALGGPTPSVFTIPAGVSFLDHLAQTVLATCAHGDDPFALADTLILLPTRRAARALSDAFLSASGQSALLMPSIRTLADLPFDEVSGLEASSSNVGSSLPDLVACNSLERLFWLAATIKARDSAADWASDPVAVLSAARALADLLDRAELSAKGEAGFDWSRLAGLVEKQEYAAHWEKSVDFLSIITNLWPEALASRGQVDAGQATRLRLERLSKRWAEAPPNHPVIIAGSTGSVRANRALMATVARLPRGTVVLPGLDQDMRESAWAQVLNDDQHPQSGLAQTLSSIGIERDQVRLWPGCDPDDTQRLRRRVLNEALTPKEVTSDWPAQIKALRAGFGADSLASGLSGLTLLSAENEEIEANVIAMALRAVLEQPEGTAALVTPDQTIARRVAAKLRRWDIAVNVSAGEPLALSATGMMVRLVTAWIEDPACPVRLLALLAHPLCSVGLDPATKDHARDVLDRHLLRGPRIAGDLQGLMGAATKQEIKDQRLFELLDALDAILSDGHASVGLSPQAGEASLPDWLSVVMDIAQRLASTPTELGEERLWAGPAGEVAATALAGLRDHAALLGAVPRSGLERLVSALLAGQVVRSDDTHPRLSILGPLEARLLSFDLLILSGLNEGVWPARLGHDPFLSPSMTGKLGIERPERRIGLSAHDFAQLAAHPNVLVTRSARRGDAPAVESRWLWRLRTLAAGAAVTLDTGQQWLDLAEAIEPERQFDANLARPEPRPPVKDRNPGKIAVTQVETWVRDPYKFYARQLMRLFPLDPVNAAWGTGKRGEAWHGLAEDVTTWPSVLGPDALARARQRLAERLGEFGASPQAAQLEAARSTEPLQFVLSMEAESRQSGHRMLVEQQLEATFATELGPMALRARVDRMERDRAGNVIIIDFKTGAPPPQKEALAFFAPQLTLTGLILIEQAQQVKGVDGHEVTLNRAAPLSLQYIKIGKESKRSTLEGGKDNITIDTLMTTTQRKFAMLCRRFADPDQAYVFQPSVKFRNKTRTFVDPYVHLARADEWGDALGEDGA